MRRYITIIFASLATLLASCRHSEVEPMIVAGYIDAATDESIIIKGDTIGVRHFVIDEQTLIEGGDMTEGNIAEIIYMPAEEGKTPQALAITTDETYAKALGRWATEPKAALAVDIELQPRGHILQHQPEQALRFKSWQLSGKKDEIIIYGIMSLPSEIKKSEKGKKDEASQPSRREYSFSITATLTKQVDSNTESRPMMVLHPQKGRESKLYLKQE